MQLTFKIQSDDLTSFVGHWSKRYRFDDESRYTDHVGKKLTATSRLALFSWKNGTGEKIAAKKLKSIEENYPLIPPEDLEDRYLDHRKPGGAIWNIFYLHCIDPHKWPIFDQHTYRAMRFVQTGTMEELSKNKRSIYSQYRDYRQFITQLAISDPRELDKAFFAFGQFLKLAKAYT